MSLPPHFDLLRAAFILLACVILTELALTVITAGGCLWLILSGEYKLGACENVTQIIRDLWSEMLAAILALLLAGRGNGKPPSDNATKQGDPP
jgi:hypothetical protein